MLNRFFITKKEISKFKIALNNPLGLTCEKITQTPRIFNTAQIKDATENILFIDPEEKILPELLLNVIEYLLKNFFLYMHQTGLYNRQLKLWQTMANITQITIYKLQEGIFTKKDLDLYLIDLFVDPKISSIKVIIDQNIHSSYKEFKKYLSRALSENTINRLKGIFYFLDIIPDNDFISKLIVATQATDPISKYESVLSDIKDVRLNVINFKYKNDKYIFEHIFPRITQHAKTDT